MAGNISDPMLVEVPQVQVSDLGKLFENSEFPAIDIDQALVYSLPLVNRFRRIIVREGVLLRSGNRWGEFAPFWDYGPHESKRWLWSAVNALTEPLPDPLRDSVPVNVTVPVVSPRRAAEIVEQSGGCRTAKVKVADRGTELTGDVERVKAVRAALENQFGGNYRIRVDANGAWNLAEAKESIAALDEAAGGLEYVEQPCKSAQELLELRGATSVPIAVDELIRRSPDPLADLPAGCADVMVVKIQPLGGVSAVIDLAKKANELGMEVVVSSAVDSAIGIGLGVRAGAAMTRLPHACGLATSQLLKSDVSRQPWQVRDGQLAVREVAINTDLISAPDNDNRRDLVNRWSQRMRDVAEVASR
ncbi:o-succinylbenzoate synthase [Varibaculum cambriense]|uniref:o-succinylbenzoate synthase n=1 Tax=Varibaculum cambriense TaxID=184870 RepID=UPI0039F53C05